MKLVRTLSLFHSRNSLLNPLSIMNTSRLFRNFVFLFSLVGMGSLAWGDRMIILKSNGGGYSEFAEISNDEIAHVIYMYGTNSLGTDTNSDYSDTLALLYSDDSNQETLLHKGTIWRGPSAQSTGYSLTGPCKLRIKNFGTTHSSKHFIAFIKVESKLLSTTSAKYASVIPENAKTNVSVILEQCTDLVNWTAANPGDFAPTVSKRFFRVRTANVPVAITGASNVAPIVITSTAHGLSTGDAISVSGVAGNTAANGVFTITKVDDNSFSLNGTTGNAAYTSGGTWLPSP